MSSKILTARYFASVGIAPKVYAADSLPKTFPVFVKPDTGHSSEGVRIVRDLHELELLEEESDFWRENLVSEYLPGAEVTVDCFSTRKDGLLFARARVREEIKDGMSVRTRDIDDSRLDELAKKIGGQLSFAGAWFFQARESSLGEFKLMEVGARIAGFSALRRAQGVNLAHLSILEADGVPLELPHQALQLKARLFLGNPECESPVRFTRLFVDLDDTLCLNGKVNPSVERLVRHARSSGAETAIITRSAYDPVKFLESIGLLKLFDQVIHIMDATPKEAFVPVGEPCLFLDDSFSERQTFNAREDVFAADPSAAAIVRGFFE